MLKNTLFMDVSDLPEDFFVDRLKVRSDGNVVLMCRPEHFCVAAALNPHMVTPGGDLKVVDHELAMRQWENLQEVLSSLELKVELVDGWPNLPDMVFTANQSFPFVDQEGKLRVLMSQMRTNERMGEVPHFRDWYQERGFQELDFPMGTDESLEGMGDLLWLHGRQLLLAGIGPRTAATVVERLPQGLSTPVIGLELVDSRFYHLDTALAVLDEKTALIHPPAFSARSLKVLESLFERLVIPSPFEAETGFACNAFGFGPGHVVMDSLCPETAGILRDLGYDVQVVDTSEFRKSGGSVFCMTMLLPDCYQNAQ